MPSKDHASNTVTPSSLRPRQLFLIYGLDDQNVKIDRKKTRGLMYVDGEYSLNVVLPDHFKLDILAKCYYSIKVNPPSQRRQQNPYPNYSLNGQCSHCLILTTNHYFSYTNITVMFRAYFRKKAILTHRDYD